ncbi:hypothetical protein [Paenibacillus sp.]|uniref:hypothetical protein n=1 Tax=Paenibacillus sp. TaxID=58172 RepID=UPI0028ABEA1B|nr:hypothetical protein [Paenibacillus sp.]
MKRIVITLSAAFCLILFVATFDFANEDNKKEVTTNQTNSLNKPARFVIYSADGSKVTPTAREDIFLLDGTKITNNSFYKKKSEFVPTPPLPKYPIIIDDHRINRFLVI